MNSVFQTEFVDATKRKLGRIVKLLGSQPLPCTVLAACPFCGQLPKVLPEDPEKEGDAWGAVACVNKRCPTGGTLIVLGDLDDTVDWGSEFHRARAVERWNGAWQ